MPWLETHVMDQRIEFVVRAGQEAVNLSALCREYGVSRKTGYKWLDRFRRSGSLTGLADRSRRPHGSPWQTAAAIEARVEALRRAHGWSGGKLQLLLASEGVVVSRRTIDRIIRRRGLIAPEDRPQTAWRRFERQRPNELWQMDFKGQYPCRGGACFPLTVLDDHSRYAIGLEALRGTTGGPVQRRLVRCFQRYGLPEAMLIDHGTPWFGTTNGHGLTRLAVFLIQQGIELIYSGVGHPQTQGKIERLHRTLNRSLRLWGVPRELAGFQRRFERFRHEYNEVRPHESIDMAVPASRYRPSPRRYQPRPTPWDYPAGADVRRITGWGAVRHRGESHFVCEALVGEWVQCQEFAGKLLVTFRQMHIREIDLKTGRTVPLIRPASEDKVSPMSCLNPSPMS